MKTIYCGIIFGYGLSDTRMAVANEFYAPPMFLEIDESDSYTKGGNTPWRPAEKRTNWLLRLWNWL